MISNGIAFRTQTEAQIGVSTTWNKTIDLEKVKVLFLAGRAPGSIAQELGYSQGGVRNALLTLGLRRSVEEAFELRTQRILGIVPTKEWAQEVMVKAGGNAFEAAKSVGIKYNTFIGTLDRLGVERNSPRGRNPSPPPSWVQEGIQLSLQGVIYRDLAEKYGVSYSKILYEMKRAGHSAPVGKQRVYDGKKTLPTPKRRVLQELLDLGYRSCEMHGLCTEIDLAHIQPAINGGAMCSANILLLCPNCHRRFDQRKLTSEEFERIKYRVRHAENTSGFVLTEYAGW